MSLQKEPIQCVPALPIKNQIDQISYGLKIHASDIFAETWNRYPCKLDKPKKCSNDHCDGTVSFFITNNSSKAIKILRLFFVRENKNAYVHYDQQLRSLFDAGNLSRVNPVTVNLKPPVISEPTKTVFPKT
jgi:hypothetical protein